MKVVSCLSGTAFLMLGGMRPCLVDGCLSPDKVIRVKA